MASSSGASSGSTGLIPNSGSEGDLRAAVDQRKQKRMLSNRESARRSRQRKQKHLDELAMQVSALRMENSQILNALNITSQHYLGVESENSVLRTQMMELSARLQALNEIISYVSGSISSSSGGGGFLCEDDEDGGGLEMRPWGGVNVNLMVMNQAIMASPDMFQYC